MAFSEMPTTTKKRKRPAAAKKAPKRKSPAEAGVASAQRVLKEILKKSG